MIRKKLFTGKIHWNSSYEFLKISLIAIALIFYHNCATVSMKSPQTTVSEPSEELLDYYRYPGNWKILWIEGHKAFDRIRIQLSETNDSKQSPLIMDFFECLDEGSHPGLLISPILGGRNKVSYHFARYFSEHGYHCIVVQRPPDLKADVTNPKEFENRIRNAVIRDRVALEWLSQQPEVDGDFLGSFGISYGGIKNVVLAGIDDRLKANVFALSGGDLASIFMTSNEDKLVEIREQLMEQYQWDLNRTEEELRRIFVTEPLSFAPYVDPANTLLILSRMDATVPRENGELLREALGYPKTIYIPAGHYSAALYTGMILFPFIETQTLSFLDKHLQTE